MARPDRPEFGETWVYESIVGALPGIDVSQRLAVAIQFVGFEAVILLLAAYYDLWTAAVAGSVAVFVATVGSYAMLRLGATIRAVGAPEPYRRLLFGSSVEVVLGVLAFVALVTHLFVFDPQQNADPIVESLFGERPPTVVVYLTLLVLWDVTYRIGTSWWASVVALWRSVTYAFDPETARRLARADLLNVGFGVTQLVLVPFVADRPVLLAALLGHVVAVTTVSGLSVVVVRRRAEREHHPTAT